MSQDGKGSWNNLDADCMNITAQFIRKIPDQKRPAFLIVHKDHSIDPNGPNGGAETATVSLARFLAKRGERVVVAAILSSPIGTLDGVEYWDLGSDYHVGQVLQRARTLGQYHLISAGRAIPIFQSRDHVECVSRILICHEPSASAMGVSGSIITQVVDQVVCVSLAQRQLFLQEGAAPEKISVIPNGVDPHIFYPPSGGERDTRRIVFSGALVEHKGIHVLINCYLKLLQHHPDIRLDVYGSASLWGREPMFDEAALTAAVPSIQFHGAVSQEVVAEAFRNACVCVIPSIWFESFSLASVEAQTCGCPVIAFNVGAVKETFLDGETGILLSNVSEQTLTHCLHDYLSRPHLMKQFSINASRFAQQRFNWEFVAAQVADICNKVANKSNQQPEYLISQQSSIP